MPKFELVSKDEATLKKAAGRSAEVTREYLGFIEQIGKEKAGRLEPSEGESLAAVRRRLGSAARLAGKDLVIKRAGNEVYFWLRGPGERRRGRRSRKKLGTQA